MEMRRSDPGRREAEENLGVAGLVLLSREVYDIELARSCIEGLHCFYGVLLLKAKISASYY